MERYACVYVIKDHLGFYTEPTVTAVDDNESLSEVVYRVLADKWDWTPNQIRTMIGLNKIGCFFVHPSAVEIINIIENELDQIIGFNMAMYTRAKSELKVRMCKALKEE